MNNNHETVNVIETNLEALSLEDLTLSDVEIDELQNEDALGIPELGASSSVYSCTSMSSL